MKRKILIIFFTIIVPLILALFVFKYCEEIVSLKHDLYAHMNTSISKDDSSSLLMEKYSKSVPLENSKSIFGSHMHNPQLIAHALGCKEGMPEYTNSKEALENSYKKGFRVVETDILLTSDKDIALAHDWYTSPLFLTEVPTMSEFKNRLIDFRYHPLSIDDLLSYMEEHPDLYVLIDTKQGDGEIGQYEQLETLYDILFKKIASCKDSTDLMNRMVITIYDDKQYEIVNNINNWNYLYTGYKRVFDPINMALFCLEHNITVIEISPSLITKNVVDIFKSKNIKVYTYSINTLGEIFKFTNLGVEGFETDFLNSNNLKNIIPAASQTEPNASVQTIMVSDLPPQNVVNPQDGLIYFNPYHKPIDITGFYYPPIEDDDFYRLNPKHKDLYPPNIDELASCTAGGRIRFKTDSAKLYICINLKKSFTYPYFAQTGSNGIDVYTGSGSDKKWCATLAPSKQNLHIIQDIISLDRGMDEITINLPLYSSVDSIVLGLENHSQISSPEPYTIDNPVVFYGSSITQGCSTVRPGTSYPDLVTRKLDSNLMNLGFSGSAKGEVVVADDIANLNMSAFVLEYDHNADDIAMLENTHYNFYLRIRNKHPNIPIVLLSRCSSGYSISEQMAHEREQVIKNTYDKAIEQGDQNIYFISGSDIIPENIRGDCLVDGVHPNDYGNHLISEAIIKCLDGAMNH